MVAVVIASHNPHPTVVPLWGGRGDVVVRSSQQVFLKCVGQEGLILVSEAAAIVYAARAASVAVRAATSFSSSSLIHRLVLPVSLLLL